LAKAKSLFTRTTFILDALDECLDFADLSTLLLQLSDNESGPVRILVSSRQEQAIADFMGEQPYISLKEESAGVSSDIKTHVHAEMLHHPKLSKLPAPLKTEITHVLLGKADGM
jgi:hypothetical protein